LRFCHNMPPLFTCYWYSLCLKKHIWFVFWKCSLRFF
jgi:hypothetical protein